MNELWRERIKKQVKEARKEQGQSSHKPLLWKIVVIVIAFQFLFPCYWKRVIYPYIYGEKTDQVQKISTEDFFEDVEPVPFQFQRNGTEYILVPKTKYQATGRVGIVDRYDTWWGKFYRGHVQGKYINLVPQDVFLVIGQMADPEVFKLFEFKHEERMGSARCKGVKYKDSFMSFYSSHKEMEESEKNLAMCEPYRKDKESNNYHPIPANEKINAALSMLGHGDVVTLEGILVDVPEMGLSTGTRKEQVHEKFRIDGRNPGKCFVLYTTKIIVNGVVYE